MYYVNLIAEFCAIPEAFFAATLRLFALIPLVFVIILLDRYFNTAAPAAAFGYLLGGLTVWGIVRKMLKQTEAGRKALEERGG